MRRHDWAATAWGILSPLLIWSIHFLFVYLVVAIACARLPERLWVGPVLWVATVATVLLILGIGNGFRRRLRSNARAETDVGVEYRTRYRIGLYSSLLSLIAVAWVALPTVFLQPCGS